jgi:hypothetical protein
MELNRHTVPRQIGKGASVATVDAGRRAIAARTARRRVLHG